MDDTQRKIAGLSLIAAPLLTEGFEMLEATVTIPADVTEVRVVLRGFAVGDSVKMMCRGPELTYLEKVA